MQAVLDCPRRDLHPRVKDKSRQDVLDVAGSRALGDHELGRDLTVGHSSGDERCYFLLALR